MKEQKIYESDDKMISLIGDNYNLLQALGSFGISLGFGDKTVRETCESNGVDTHTFLAVVNFTINGIGVAEDDERISVSTLLHYLEACHAYFIDFRLPAIRRKLIGAIDCSTKNQIAFLILKFYDEYAAEVARHMDYENTHVHPYVERLLARRLPSETFASVVNQHTDNHASIEKSITELKSIIIKYYPSDSNAPLLNDVLMDIYMTEEDLLEHCRLEDTLFAECVRRLEERVRLSCYDVADDDDYTAPAEDTGTDGLSEREKEVIINVVKGMSNKEIAEQMFISVNTVMTHRRNISRKLNIRSAAGLTIYAIVNGLINLEDVRL